jgi:hypothetical protein
MMVTVAERPTPAVAEPPPRDRCAVPAAIAATSLALQTTDQEARHGFLQHIFAAAAADVEQEAGTKRPSVFRPLHKLFASYGSEVVDVRGSGYDPFPPRLGRSIHSHTHFISVAPRNQRAAPSQYAG